MPPSGHSRQAEIRVQMQPRGTLMPHLWAEVNTPAARGPSGHAKTLVRMQPRGTFMPHLRAFKASAGFRRTEVKKFSRKFMVVRVHCASTCRSSKPWPNTVTKNPGLKDSPPTARSASKCARGIF